MPHALDFKVTFPDETQLYMRAESFFDAKAYWDKSGQPYAIEPCEDQKEEDLTVELRWEGHDAGRIPNKHPAVRIRTAGAWGAWMRLE